MTDDEYLIYEALDFKNLKINEVSDILDKTKHVFNYSKNDFKRIYRIKL